MADTALVVELQRKPYTGPVFGPEDYAKPIRVVRCRHCDRPRRDDGKICQECGSYQNAGIPRMMKCPVCRIGSPACHRCFGKGWVP